MRIQFYVGATLQHLVIFQEDIVLFLILLIINASGCIIIYTTYDGDDQMMMILHKSLEGYVANSATVMIAALAPPTEHVILR